jgi:serine phosphatase RsbU (regulator of sigma subunit)
VYRPAEFVSGDLYDVQRLDEERVAIAVADATGHGIPAALLTVFVKRTMRGKETSIAGDRLLAPDEVLRRLNRELLEADLAECRFVAAVYAVLNTRTGDVCLARAGAPYPVIRRSRGSLEVVRSAGPVAGVIAGAEFAAQRARLGPGDALILHTDGLDASVAERVWCERLRCGGVAAALEHAEARHDVLRRMGHAVDDLTIVSVGMDGSKRRTRPMWGIAAGAAVAS